VAGGGAVTRVRYWGPKDRRRQTAVRLHAQGLSLRQIARQLKVSHMTVSRDLAAEAALSRSTVLRFIPAGMNLTGNVTADVTATAPRVVTLAERRRP